MVERIQPNYWNLHLDRDWATRRFTQDAFKKVFLPRTVHKPSCPEDPHFSQPDSNPFANPKQSMLHIKATGVFMGNIWSHNIL